MAMRSAFRRVMIERGWGRPGTRLLIGVSGGVDSMVLLDLLRSLEEEMGFSLVAAHLDHGLRGAESDRDARFVKEMGAKWKVPVEMERVDVGAIARERKIPVQVAAREARYAFYGRVAKKWGAAWVVLGHHAGDLAETVMMRWLRGSSVEGLRGIPLQTGDIIRPLLFFTREAILAYARKRGIPFVEDSTNRKTVYFRNRVRLELIPLLERKYQPALLDHLVRYAAYFGEISDFLTTEGAKQFREVRDETGAICLDRFRDLHVALQRQILERFFLEGGWIDFPLSFEKLEHILTLTRERAGSQRFPLGKGRWVVREYDRLFVTDVPAYPPIRPVSCPVPGSVDIREIGNRLTVEVVDSLPESLQNPRQEAHVDGDQIGKTFWVRSFRPGDRVVTTGEIKVKKLFIDRKIPARLRPTVPIVGSERSIVWVGGVRVDRRFIVTKETKRVLRLRFSKPVRTE